MTANTTLLNSSDSTWNSEYLFRGYWREHGDPRVAQLFFMDSFAPPLFILTVYSAFVLRIGPWLMRDRKPFSLKSILIVYNLILSAGNGYFFIRYLFLYDYGLDMFNVKFPAFSDIGAKPMTVIALNHVYMFSKFIDLLDTVFFVLRKKNNQITGLHFFHHLTVPFISWTYFRLCGNNAYIIPFQLLNCAIHTFMYGYYGLATCGPALQPYLWWKRYLTQFQIVQFVILFAYALFFVTYQEGYDFFYSLNLLIQSLLYIYLFGSFYLKTYQEGQKMRQLKTMKTTTSDTNNNDNNKAVLDKNKLKYN